MITRKDYMQDGKNLHRQYYSQFITPEMEALILKHMGLDRLMASKDKGFNDIPIYTWDAVLFSMYDKRTGEKLRDRMASKEFGNDKAFNIIWHFNLRPVNKLMREAGDHPSLSGYTCTFKECARQMVERARKSVGEDDGD